MTNISERETAHGYALSSARETQGEAFLRWAALTALVVETILVVGGIVFAIHQGIVH